MSVIEDNWLNVNWECNGQRIGALSYAELGTMITQSGAEYAYFRHAFGPLPAFIFCWVCTLVLKPSQLAIICLAFAKYTVEAFVTECEPPVFIVQLLCAAVIGTPRSPKLKALFHSFPFNSFQLSTFLWFVSDASVRPQKSRSASAWRSRLCFVCVWVNVSLVVLSSLNEETMREITQRRTNEPKSPRKKNYKKNLKIQFKKKKI